MDRRAALTLIAILVVALVLRLIPLLEQRSDILFDHPVLDEQRYVDEARALASGGAVEDRPYWQPPGIIYALAATFRIAGDGLVMPRLIQVLVSVASCLLLFSIGRRLFGERVGLAAAAILAAHGVVVFETTELLPPTWILFFDLVALLLLLRAGERRTAPRSFAAGLALGVSAVFSPTILPFVLVAAVHLRRPAAIAALVAGVLLPILPVTARNHRHGGELVLISTNGGLNLHLGNNADYRETFALRPGRHWEELIGEPHRHGVTRPGAQSSFFTRKALSFVADHPIDAVGLHLRKTYLFFHGAEIPRDTDLHEARDHSVVLRALVWPGPFRFPDGVLIPLALLGIAALWKDRRRLAVPLTFLATLAIFVPLFFVTSRHRVPALPMFALFAAAGVPILIEHWKAWRPRRRVLASSGAVALLVMLNLPTWEGRLSYRGELDFYRGIAWRDLQRPTEAVAAFRRATTAAPADARPWFELGNTLDSLGEAGAVDAWRRAAEADPWDSRPARRISVALTQGGDLDGATAALEASIAAGLREPAHYAPDHLNLAFLREQRGDTAAAIERLEEAAHADPAYFRNTAPRMIGVGGPRFDAALRRILAAP